MFQRLPFEAFNLSEEDAMEAGAAFRHLCRRVLEESCLEPQLDITAGGLDLGEQSSLVQVTYQTRASLGRRMLADITQDIFTYTDDKPNEQGRFVRREWYSLTVSQRRIGSAREIYRYISAAADRKGEVIRKDWDNLGPLPNRARSYRPCEERNIAMLEQQAKGQNGLAVGMSEVGRLHFWLYQARFSL